VDPRGRRPRASRFLTAFLASASRPGRHAGPLTTESLGWSGDGGAIYNEGGIVTLTGTSLAHSSAENRGGEIYNARGDMTITSSDLSDSDAGQPRVPGAGGAIYNAGTVVIRARSTMTPLAGTETVVRVLPPAERYSTWARNVRRPWRFVPVAWPVAASPFSARALAPAGLDAMASLLPADMATLAIAMQSRLGHNAALHISGRRSPYVVE
jgi:hypothetical protein